MKGLFQGRFESECVSERVTERRNPSFVWMKREVSWEALKSSLECVGLSPHSYKECKYLCACVCVCVRFSYVV